MKTIIILVCLLFFDDSLSQPNPLTCRHTTKDTRTNSEINYNKIHLIRPIDNAQDFFAEDRFNPSFTYNFRICENVVQKCGQLDETPFCQRNTNGMAWTIGSLESQTILDYPSSDKSRGFMIEYSNGTECSNGKKRRIIITIECDPFSIGPLSSISTGNHQNEDPCEYELYAKSQYACPEVSENVCQGRKGCKECVEQSGCGWCGSTQLCTLGDSLRPLDGTYCLGSGYYFYGSGSCVDCESVNSCSECTTLPDCKWCSGKCSNVLESCEATYCKCPPCQAGSYCGSEGGKCKKLANTGGLFVGGMFLGFAIAGVAIGAYLFLKRSN